MARKPATSDTTSRWSRRKDARPVEILDAALNVFAQKGYAAARMDDIARQAGVTKGTLYLYFDSKETVFKTLVRETIAAAIAAAIEGMRDHQGSAREMLRFMLSAAARAVGTGKFVVLPKIILGESANFPDLTRFCRKEIIDRGLPLIASVISRGIEQGEFRPVPPQHVAQLCIAPVLLAAMWRTTFAQFDEAPYDDQALIETHLDVMLHGLARQERPPC